MVTADKQLADERTAAIERQIKALTEILASALRAAPFRCESLLVQPRARTFDPGALGEAIPEPDWSDFAPPRPTGLARLFRRARYRRLEAVAQVSFQTARSTFKSLISERQRELALAKSRFDREVTRERAEAARRNAFVRARQSALAAGDSEAVEWFVGCVLDASRYPDVFPREHQVTYRRKTRDITVEFELPPPRIVPAARAYRYVSTRDAVEPVPRPLREIKQRYAKLIARIALRTMHEIFTATQPDVIDAVTFNGYVTSTDPATGKPAKPYLVSASVNRSALADIVLAAVDPTACLTHLNAQLSPDPHALDPIHPTQLPDPSPLHPI